MPGDKLPIPERDQLLGEIARLRAQVDSLQKECQNCAMALTDEGQKKYLLMALMDNVTDHIYFKDRQSRFTLVSRSTCKWFRLSSPDDAIGKTDYDIFSEEHAGQAFRDEQEIMRTGQPIVGKEEKETWPDGSFAWVSTTKMPLYGANGTIIGTFGISRDITLRKRMEAELRESEARYRSLIELAPDVIYRTDVNGQLLFVSDAVRGLGFTVEEMLERPLSDFVHPEDRAELARCTRRQALGEIHSCELEMRVRAPAGDVEADGEPAYRNMLVTSRAQLRPDGRSGVLAIEGMMHDISIRKRAELELQRHREHLEDLVTERTKELSEANARLQREIAERERAENALLQAGRMDAIRSIASGVASNFNSILDAISGYASNISDNVPPGTRMQEDALRILESTRRAGELTQRLMGVAGTARKGKKPEPQRLGSLVEEAVALLREIFSKQKIEISVKEAHRMPWIMTERTLFMDLLMTFLLNAAEAMPGGGRVRIDWTERVLHRPGIRHDGERKLPYVALRIRDTGCGIAAADLKHIFEPFFTTRKTRPAFGLGLSFAQMTIQGMGGWISVRSTVGSGTSFRIFLPKSKAAPPKAQRGARPARGRMVLVLDDREESLVFMREALEAAGFKVLAAADPRHGVELYERNSDKISLSIVDALIADGSGHSFMRAVKDMSPHPSMVVTSGFSREYVRGILPPGGWAFIQKPFDGPQLMRVVNDVLSARDGGVA